MNKVLIAIPTAGGIHEMTAAFAARVTQKRHTAYTAGMAVFRGRPHDYVRNQAVKAFLASDCTHLFFLDSDVEPPLDVLTRLLSHDAQVATGFYPITHNGLRWAVCLERQPDTGRWQMTETLPDAPRSVAGCGAGCLLIRRDVFTTLGWPWFQWDQREDGYQLGEDLFFCQRCTDAGIPILADPEIECNHYKEINLRSAMPHTRNAHE